MQDWVPLLAATVAGLLGLLGVVLGARAQHGLSRQLERQRRDLDRAERSRQLLERYQEPLVRAAYDLQSRLWNILCADLLTVYAAERTSSRWTYARDSTAWLFGQYFGWVEIVRREAQFLRLEEATARRELQEALGSVAHQCSSDRPQLDPLFQTFRTQQRGLGELMIVKGSDADGATRTDCMGFAAFSAELQRPDSAVATWFAPLLRDVEALATDPRRGSRLLALQHALIDLVKVIDPACERFPADRDKACESTGAAALRGAERR